MAMTLVYRWCRIVIENRKKNIMSRLNRAKVAREEREQRIDEERLRMEDRATKCAEEKEKFEHDNSEGITLFHEYTASLETETPMELEEGEDAPTLPVFDEKYWLFGYDEEHPEIFIPKEIADDVDQDWRMLPEQKPAEIADYIQGINELIAAQNAPPVVEKHKGR